MSPVRRVAALVMGVVLLAACGESADPPGDAGRRPRRSMEQQWNSPHRSTDWCFALTGRSPLRSPIERPGPYCPRHRNRPPRLVRLSGLTNA